MEKLHADPERWAVYASVLVFSIASFTTNRVECRWNMLVQRCGKCTHLVLLPPAGGYITSLVATKDHCIDTLR